MQIKLKCRNIGGNYGNRTGLDISGGGFEVLFRETPSERATVTRLALGKLGNAMGAGGMHQFETLWDEIDPGKVVEVKKIVKIASQIPSKRPELYLKLEVTGDFCAVRCELSIEITAFIDDPVDPLDDHMDGVVIYNRPAVKARVGILTISTGNISMQSKVTHYSIIPP